MSLAREEKSRFTGLSTKLAGAFALLAILVSAVLTFSLYLVIKKELRQEIRARLHDSAAVAAMLVDGDRHARLTEPSQENSPDYLAIKRTLQKVLKESTDIRFVYTMRKNAEGEIIFVVDAETDPKEIAHLGRVYGKAGPALQKNYDSMTGPVVESGFYTDEWGTFLTGYAPIYDSAGRKDGVLGMDISIEKVQSREHQFLYAGLLVFFCAVVLAVAAGLLLGHSLAGPIETLRRAAEAVAEGDYSHRVPVTTRDEIGVLAAAFNIMTQKMEQSRTDLTLQVEERKNAENALRASEEQYRKLYSDAYVGLYKACFDDGRIITCNNRFAQMLGYESAENLPPDVSLGPARYADQGAREELNSRLLTTGRVDHFETLFVKKDGTSFWIRFSARLVDHGENVEGMAVDFTDEKNAWLRLAEAEKKYRGIFENAMEGIFQCTAAGELVTCNPAMAIIAGYASAEEIISNRNEFCGRFFADEANRQDFFRKISTEKTVSGFELRFRRMDGTLRWGLVHARAVSGDAGEETIEGMLTDITERKNAEVMAQAHIESQARNRAITQFIEAMSQEMRTPMNAVVGMIELLRQTRLSEQQAQYVQTLRVANDEMLALIANILVLSKAEAKTLELEKIPFNLLELTEKTCESLAVKAHEKNMNLTCAVGPEVRRSLVGDPFHLRQILVNMVNKAMHLSDAIQGELTVTVERDTQSPRPGGFSANAEGLRFCVATPAADPASSHLQGLFDSFSSKPATGKEEAGEALSLRIANELVGLMGGKITYSSSPEKGASICFTAFFERQEKGAASSSLRNLNVLIADNDSKNRQLVKEILNEQGARVTEADDAQTALTMLKDAWMLPKPYDMVLVSQVMPDLNGMEAAEIIKIEHLCPVCVLILSFTATHEDVDRAREIGVNNFLKKPFKKAQVLRALTAAVRREKPERPGAEPVERDEEQGLPPIDLLLVDDSETNRFVIRAYLKNTPCRVHIAENGEKAVEKFAAQNFDLVLMDMQMPVMDGYEATATIRKWEKQNRDRRTPIIAMTADARAEDEVKYIDTGFDGLLAKPIKKNTLLTALFRQVAVKKKVQPDEEIDRVLDTLGVGADEPILAWVNPDLDELAPGYLKTLGEQAEKIQKALDAADFELVRMLGHQMKGEGNAFGFEAVSRLGAVMEEAALRKHADKVAEYAAKLMDYLNRVEIV
ncbi:MAG: response regulator [Thermodesulfobacteriota bacterium]